MAMVLGPRWTKLRFNISSPVAFQNQREKGTCLSTLSEQAQTLTKGQIQNLKVLNRCWRKTFIHMRRIPECEGVGETSAESAMFKVAQLRARDTDRTFTFKPTTKDKFVRISPAMRGGIKAGIVQRKKFPLERKPSHGFRGRYFNAD
eukprot:FR736643.1.p1 GENE.FR736643.1~~FR736643.1.p1  ORF type:complete len:147 (+),score=6.46 FR736643.1:449-889(+)